MTTTISKEEYLQMYEIIGACMEVHGIVGRGLEEPMYQEMLELELIERGIPYEREKRLTMQYKGHTLKKEYYADFYINGIVVELKAVESVNKEHRAQLFNYMRITDKVRGLLINFGEKNLHTERYLYQKDSNDFALLTEYNLSSYVRKE